MKRSAGRQRLRRILKRHGTLCESRAVCFEFSTLLRGVRNGHAEKEAIRRFLKTFGAERRKRRRGAQTGRRKEKRLELFIVSERQAGKSHGFGIFVFFHREENIDVFAEGFALIHI